MVFFLLPWSARHSDIHTSSESVGDAGLSFAHLNPIREKLMEKFGIKDGPLAPLWRRYRGAFWEELCFWALPPKVQREIEERSLVPSPLFGLLRAGDLVPKYPLRWETRYEGKSLRSFWRDRLGSLLSQTLVGVTVFDFLTSRDRKALPIPDSAERVVFEYYRKGKRVLSPLPHRAYTLRYILEMGVGKEDLERINFLDYRVEKVSREGNLIRVIMVSEGRYL
ncbi:MAG TPA: peroxide stress protein YaaA [Aquifex aeolicus]|nr:peroxide stress protein YaaA [Aquifex aeolicus]